MNGTERCPKCGRELIAEETQTHQCRLQVGVVARVADLTYEWWTSAKLPQYGGEVLIVKTTDGTLYRIRPTPDAQHPQKSPDDAPLPVRWSLIVNNTAML